jgi:predicted O-methyltransferase YrrM
MNELIEKYCEQHSSNVSNILNELERITYLRTTQPHMVSGALQGEFLIFLSKIIQPKLVIDIGTFTGYSAICLAQGLCENGIVHTIDIDDEKESIVHEFIQKANLQNSIKYHIGKALDIIPTIDGEIDMVFIDADKETYPVYFDLVIDRVQKGGIILADNVLWKGKILNEKMDKKTQIIDDFNKKIQADSRVENILLPLRDGLMMMRKM